MKSRPNAVRVLVAIDHHFVRDPAGVVYVGPPMAIRGYRFWEPYLKVFEEVVVLARVRQGRVDSPPLAQAGGRGVGFHDLVDYQGPWQYLRRLAGLKRDIRQAIAQADTSILRVPGAIGQLAWLEVEGSGRPYGLEIVADPWDMFSPGAVPSIVRPVVRRAWSRKLQRMCHRAPAVSYVTQQALQKRYPPGPHSWATHVSDVDLTDGFANAGKLQKRAAELNRRLTGGGVRLRIGFLGAFAQMYKAPDILLRAVARVCDAGSGAPRDRLEVEVVLAGDGKYRRAMEVLAGDLGLGDHARFLGALMPGEAVQRFLDEVDLFVLPSRQEGLPRAMVEAMARGCPVIGSRTGGIPELLPPEDLVPPGEVDALAEKIQELLRDPDRMHRMIHRNWEQAQQFRPDVLEERRLTFYRKVREQAEEARRAVVPAA